MVPAVAVMFASALATVLSRAVVPGLYVCFLRVPSPQTPGRWQRRPTRRYVAAQWQGMRAEISDGIFGEDG